MSGDASSARKIKSIAGIAAPERFRDWILLLLALMLSAGMWGVFRWVMIPHQESSAQTENRPRGNLSDLYPRWLGARELLLRNRDPYSPELTTEIQQGYWGRAVDPENPNDPPDQAGFAYPLYIVFILAPTILMPFESVQILYSVVGIIATAASLGLWCKAFEFSPKRRFFIVAAVLLLGSYPVVQAVFLQQPLLIVAAFIAAALAFISRDRLLSAGFVLALAMIKPQVALPVAAWLMLWAASRWKERRALLLSFGVTMAVLCVGAELLLPGWFWKWRDSLVAYSQYAVRVPSQVQLILGRYSGIVAGWALLLFLAVFCWKARQAAPSTDTFKFIVPLILAVNLIINPLWHEYDVLLLLPAILLFFQWRNELRLLSGVEKAFICASAVALAWQWPAALVVTAMSLWAPELARQWLIVPWLSVLFAPVPIVVSLLLAARAQLWLRHTGQP